MSLSALYNAVEYPSYPIPECHPVRMATIAALAGLTPPPVDTATVVDIGCATAANIIAIAAAYPAGQVIGVDPSEEQLARATELAEAAGLDNTTFIEGTSSKGEDGHADYVIVHGVLSWVAGDVRPSVIAEAARSVRPGGLVQMSFNVDPGAIHRTLIHTVGRRAAAQAIEAGDAEAAKEAVVSRLKLAVRLAGPGTTHGQLAAAEAERISRLGATYLFHDELTPNWTPLSFSAVVELARQAGLEYVGMLRAADRWRLRIPANQVEMIEEQAGDDPLVQEQVADDVLGHAFHSCLFVRGERPVAGAAVAGPPAASWHVTSNRETWPAVPGPARQAVAEAIRNAGWLGSSIGDVAEAAGVSPDEAVQHASWFDARQLATLAVEAPPISRVPGDRPEVSPLARAQVERGETLIFSLNHTCFRLEDPVARAVIGLADGTRDRAAIRRTLVSIPGSPKLDIAAVDAQLNGLAEVALLTP